VERVAADRRPPAIVPPRLPGGRGLSLVGWTESPLVGRRTEQDLLWDELRGVASQREPRTVALLGEPGSGRRSLAQAVARALEESGAGRGLRIGAHPAAELARRGFRLPGDPDRALACAPASRTPVRW
jgi:Cdc6-like AAA superfamily ATPase